MDDTQAFDPHGAPAIGVSEPRENPDRTTPYAEATQHEPATPYEPTTPYDASVPAVTRPTGMSWVTLTLGVLCLGLAALVLTLQVTDVSIDWSTAAPVFVVTSGALLVIAGIASMVTKGRGKS